MSCVPHPNSPPLTSLLTRIAVSLADSRGAGRAPGTLHGRSARHRAPLAHRTTTASSPIATPDAELALPELPLEIVDETPATANVMTWIWMHGCGNRTPTKMKMCTLVLARGWGSTPRAIGTSKTSKAITLCAQRQMLFSCQTNTGLGSTDARKRKPAPEHERAHPACVGIPYGPEMLNSCLASHRPLISSVDG